MSHRRHISWALAFCCALPACARPKAPQDASQASHGSSAPGGERANAATGRRLAPPGLILVGRVRGYEQWLGLKGKTPAIAWAERKLAEELPILGEVDLNQSIEFAVVYDPTFKRSSPPSASSEKDPESETDESATDDDAASSPETNPSKKSGGSIEGHFLAAVSFPLRAYSPEQYVKLGYSALPEGAFAKDDCLVSPALGTAKARLICSDHLDVTHQLRNYLTRGLPLETLSTSPIFAEFKPQPLRPLWAPARAELSSKLHQLSALGGATANMAEQQGVALLTELDSWVATVEAARLEAGLNGHGEFEANVQLTVKSPEPWLMQSYLMTAESAHDAPASFLGLPDDVDSAGYHYGLPEARMAVIQRALVNLGQEAQKEYGPPSRAAGDVLTKAQGKSLDRIAELVLDVLGSSCIRSPLVVWADGKFATLPTGKTPISADRFWANWLGYRVVALPSASQCRKTVTDIVEMLDMAHRALPAGLRKRYQVTLSPAKPQNFAGLPPATVVRFTLSRDVVNALLDASKAPDAASTSQRPWGPAKGPLTFTLLTLTDTGNSNTDWFAVGLDEEGLVRAMRQILHPSARSLRDRPDIARSIATKPIQVAQERFSRPAFTQTLTGMSDGLFSILSRLSGEAAVMSTTRVARRPGGSEAVASYTIPSSTMDAVREILNWDVERFEALTKEFEAVDSPPSGPIGILRKRGP